MNEIFIQDWKLEEAAQYVNPFVILMHGEAASGKTTIAKQLSKELKICLVSHNYIRNYFYLNGYDNFDEIQSKTKDITEKRIQYLKEHQISFVEDYNWNRMEDKKKLDALGYQVITIHIISDDAVNLERSQLNKMDFLNRTDSVIGDSGDYSHEYSKEDYELFQKRKVSDIEEQYDYVIDNRGSLEALDIQVQKVIEQIKKTIN